jgi:hypothetical protein
VHELRWSGSGGDGAFDGSHKSFLFKREKLLARINRKFNAIYLILIIELCPAGYEGRIEQFFRQGRVNIDKTHASPKGMRRRFLHQLHREAMHPFCPILPCAYRGHVPGLLQMLLIYCQFSCFRRYRDFCSLRFAEVISGASEVKGSKNTQQVMSTRLLW